MLLVTDKAFTIAIEILKLENLPGPWLTSILLIFFKCILLFFRNLNRMLTIFSKFVLFDKKDLEYILLL